VTEPITVERDGHVLLIGINRPAKRNAFNLAVIDALGAAYEILGTDDELHTGVLFAHGDHFSAGLDLAEVGPAVAEHGPRALSGSHRFDPFGVWGDPVPKPVVLAVNGIAFTLSIELALACDIVIAAEDVRFRQLEIARGIVPFGGPRTWPSSSPGRRRWACGPPWPAPGPAWVTARPRRASAWCR
jgi:enoyl-CoA hydratase